MDQLVADRVVLLLLDHDRNRALPLNLDVEQGLALRDQVADVTLGDLERAGVAALAVDDAGHEALAAQAAALARAESLARSDLERCSAVAMGGEG